MHDTPTSGHEDVTRTIELIKNRFYWPLLKIDVQKYIRKCNKCIIYESLGNQKAAKLITYRVGAPLERLSADIGGPFPTSHRGNIHILVVVYCFSKFSQCDAMPDQEAETAA